MARHAWDRKKHGPAPRRDARHKWMVVGGSLFCAVIVGMGLNFLLLPRQCDFHSMDETQRCQPQGRTERLVDPPERRLDPMNARDVRGYFTGRTLDQQIVKNRIYGTFFTLVGFAFGGGYAFFVVGDIRDWRARLRAR